MRILVLALLGSAVLVTVGCSSSRSLSRNDVMADHIASVRPDGSAYQARATRTAPAATYVAQAATPAYSQPTYSQPSSTYSRGMMPPPPPPPSMTTMRSTTIRSGAVQPVARSTARAVARPAARPAVRTRRASVARPAPRASKSSGWKLFGGGCAGGT